MTDWNRYRKCPVCAAEMDKPCLTISGYGVMRNGEPFYPTVAADRPHSTRERRTGGAR